MVWYYRRLVCAHLSVCAHTSSSTLVTRSAAVCIERGLLKTFKVHHWRRKVLSGKKKSTGYWLAPYKPRVLVTLGVLCQPAVKRSCGARLLPSCARAATYDSTSTTPYYATLERSCRTVTRRAEQPLVELPAEDGASQRDQRPRARRQHLCAHGSGTRRGD